ncbi:hypothetical protein [Haloplanus salilacus]|uniref:hypothetical protein n=1 Tax=Haloplanus salilacus TaxID=2949994 RepID=UPI0030CCE9C1
MEPARDVLAQFLDDLNDDLADADIETAQNRIESFQDEYDLQIREGGIAIGVHIDIWSYDYKDDIYFLVRGYDSITTGVEEVVVDHVYSLVSAMGEGAAERASRMRDEPPTVTETSYESMETDIDIDIHADVYYHRMRASCDGKQTGQVTQPSKSDILDAVESVIPNDERV